MFYIILCSGLEVFHQVPLQIVLLLMATTATATTGGLETLFKQDSMFGIPMDPRNHFDSFRYFEHEDLCQPPSKSNESQ